MNKSVYIIATNAHSGKSVVSLGVLQMIMRNTAKVGYFRPIVESKSKKDFKNDFNNCKNLMKKLEDKEFKISKLWSRNAVDIYKKYKNDSEVIKKKV